MLSGREVERVVNYLEPTRRAMEERILNAAGEMLAERGAAGLTMRALAERVGCSTTVFYDRFGNKEGLLEALLVEGFSRLWDAERQAEVESDPLRRLRSLGHAYWRTATQHPNYYKAMFGGALPDYEPSARAKEAGERTFRVLVDAVAACMERGALIRDDPVRVATLLWAALHGLAHLHLQGLLPVEDVDSVLDWVLSQLISGLSPK